MKDRKDDLVLIDHIVDAIGTILLHTRSLNEEAFLQDRLVQDAVIRNFTVIGEAVKHINDDLKRKYPLMEWKKMAGMRDKLVHDHMGIDNQAIWLTIQRILPGTLEEFLAIRKDLE